MTTYHVIPHSHWDREWYLTFEHFRVRLVHMLDDLLDILDADPAYASFLLDGQTVVVDDYLAVRPERRARIEALVREGRLAVGPWFVLPDSFLVSGEALVRNLMRGRAAARALGGAMDVGYIPDSFGHTAQLPQILRGFGIGTAVVWRGFGGEPGQEGSEYRWHSPDGSAVLMEHLSDVGYSAATFPSTEPADVDARFADIRSRLDPRARTPERLVLSGGDHHWPAAALPAAVAHLNGVLGQDERVAISSLARFAEALESAAEGLDLPGVRGELRFGYRWAFNVTGGVYSSRMPLKQANAAAQRRLERLLEPMNVLVVRAGGRSQRALLGEAWRTLLLNHPHDSICGCSIDPVHREMTTRFEQIDGMARGIDEAAWRTLAPTHEGLADDAHTLTVFNPSPFARDAVLTVDLPFFSQQVVVGLNPDVLPAPPRPPVEGFAVVGPDGAEVPAEILSREVRYGIAHSRFTYPEQSLDEVFTVRLRLRALPPLGLRTLAVERRTALPAHAEPGLRGDACSVENDHLRVEAAADGTFTVTDKATGRTFGPLGGFEDGADAGDEYNYSPPPADRVLRSAASAEVTLSEVPGVLQRGVRADLRWRLPAALTDDLGGRADETVELRLSTTVTLTPFSRHVAFETTVENVAQDHRLRVLFETGRRTNTHHADNAFAVLTREQQAYDPADFAIEVPAAVAPMHRFVTVEDAEAGATLLADGLPEYELVHDSGGRLALTLLRCVGELGRDGLAMRPGGQGGWRNATPEAQCPGAHTFRYAFLPHGPGWAAHAARIHEAAEAFAVPLPHVTGTRAAAPSDRSFLHVEPSALVLSALKEAEDGDGVVLRVVNPTPEPVDGRLVFADVPTRVVRADLEERDGAPLSLTGATLHDTWPPFRIHTYRLRFPASTP